MHKNNSRYRRFFNFKKRFYMLWTHQIYFRNTYQNDKKTAATARKISIGETVAPLQTVGADQCLFLLSLGEQFGREQWR